MGVVMGPTWTAASLSALASFSNRVRVISGNEGDVLSAVRGRCVATGV